MVLAEPRTRDVVQLARSTFETARRAGRASAADVDEGFRQTIHAEDAPLRALWNSLPATQQNVLRALAVRSRGLTSAVQRRAFSLGDTGPTTLTAQALVARDTLVKAEPGYRYDSPFFRGWVIENTLADVGMALDITHLPHAGAGV